MLAGLAGSVLPILPGPPLILLGAFLYAWYTEFTVISWGALIVLSLLTLFIQAMDYLASMFGAKKFGASSWGMFGAFLGGIIGLFLGGIFGIIIGPFLGAFVLEMLHGKSVQSSVKIGFGTLIGFLASTVGKFVVGITMIGIFIYQLF
jgi:uncharacterized protein YqgC (DUF456 family)